MTNRESRNKCLRRFDCTDTLLTDEKKQAAEKVLVENFDIVARQRMEQRILRSLKWNSNQKRKTLLKAKDLPMKNYLRKVSMFKFVLLHNYGITTVLPFSKYASPFFHRGNPTENDSFLRI